MTDKNWWPLIAIAGFIIVLTLGLALGVEFSHRVIKERVEKYGCYQTTAFEICGEVKTND